MDSENNKNSSLQLLHEYDSSDSSDESNQNISEKYVSLDKGSKQNVDETNRNASLDLKTDILATDSSTAVNLALRSESAIDDTAIEVDEVNANNNQGYNSVDMEHRDVKSWIDDESCDDDDDDSESSSSREWVSLKRGEVISTDSDDDDEDVRLSNARGGTTFINKKVALKVRGELAIEDLPPIEDLTISVPNDQCVQIGTVYDIVDQLVIVKTLPDKPTLDMDTVLFLEEGTKTLGQIFEVFGQVTQPFYCVRFNSNDHIKDRGIEKNMTVYYAPKSEYTHLVYTAELMKAKGSDASWKDDVEVPEQLCDYSDDEQERKAKQALKEKKKKTDNANQEDGETSSGSKKPKLTPFEVKMNEINLRKTAECNKMNSFRKLCGGRGREVFMLMEQHNQNVEIRSQGQGRGRTLALFSDMQRSAPENPFENPFDIPHGFRVFPPHCPRFPPVPGTIRNPMPINRPPAFSPPPGQSYPRPPLPFFGRGSANSLGLAPRYRYPRPGGGPFFYEDRPNF